MWGSLIGKPAIVATPAVVDERKEIPQTESRCLAIDAVTGAVCTRNLHVIDKTHWFEDCDFRIQWATPPTITLP